MKILILQSELGVLRGGGETFTRSLFAAVAERGHRIAAAFVADPHGNYPVPMPSYMQPIPIPGWWSRNLGQATLSLLGQRFVCRNGFRRQWDRVQEAFSWRAIKWHDQRFKKRVESHFATRWTDYDAVYVHGNVALASSIARRCPTILRLPGPLTAESEPLLRSVHAVCANGDALSRIRAFLGNEAIELPPGLDSEVFRPGESFIRASLGWTDQHYVIGYVGRLTHLKGIDLLAAAFRELSRTAADARLIIIGNGDGQESIRSVLAREFQRGTVHHQRDMDHEQLPEWYRAMDLLVMPSRYENFSNTILEALACGVPFLGSDIGGNNMMANLGAGRLFQRESVTSLLNSLQDSRKNRLQLSAQAQPVSLDVRNRYSWLQTAERLESIIVSRLGVQT